MGKNLPLELFLGKPVPRGLFMKKKKKISKANKQRGATKKATQKRHGRMICKTFELKFQQNKFNKETAKAMPAMFAEAKYFYNHLVAQDDYKTVDSKINVVPVKVIDKFEDRELSHLGSQMKQAIITRFADAIKGLGELKAKGHTVGKLKFKSNIDSIPLKQHGDDEQAGTYRILNDRFVKIQNIKQKLVVNGLEQFIYDTEFEISSANLIRKGGDYFLKVMVYFKPEYVAKKQPPAGSHTGIDYGVGTQMTLSQGIQVKFNIQPTERLKKLSRDFSRKVEADKKNRPKKKVKAKKVSKKTADKKVAKKKQATKVEPKKADAKIHVKPVVEKRAPKKRTAKEKKRLDALNAKKVAAKNKPKPKKKKAIKEGHHKRKNYYKALNKLRKEYRNIDNIKKDIRNKSNHILTTNFESISTQNESFRGWVRLFGRKMFNTSLGGMRADLKKKAATHNEIDRFYPTTQECIKCKHRQKMPLKDRVFDCKNPTPCDNEIDRDWNSSLTIDEQGQIQQSNILKKSNKKIVPPVQREIKPVGEATTTKLLDAFNAIPYVSASSLHQSGSHAEATRFSAW